MEKDIVKEILYKKYIEPTKKKREDFIGIEIEIPILNLNKQAVDFTVVHKLTEKFISHFNFVVTGTDDDGNVFSAQDMNNGDILSYDCSYNNLELSMGKEKELSILDERFKAYYNFIQQEFQKDNYTLTGMGVNPYRDFNRNVPIPNERYRMLFHYLGSYKNHKDCGVNFHPYPTYGSFSSASQVQLDVDFSELIPTIQAFSKLEPVKAFLFSNSVLIDSERELLCCRDMLWEDSMHGLNPKNIGMFNCDLNSTDDLLSYIESTSIYCVQRDGKYIDFAPIKISEYFDKPYITGEYFEDGEYKAIKFKPEINDVEYLRTFKFEDLTFRGTIEFRSVCCQPIADRMTVAAFHLGLKNKARELNAILDEDYTIYHHGYSADQLRKIFVKRDLPEFLDLAKMKALTRQVLDLSYTGLAQRGFGEEKYLTPLYNRLDEGENPAQKFLNFKESHDDLEKIILEYAKVD